MDIWAVACILTSMEKISFIKMHGLGNDFVLVDNRKYNINYDQTGIRSICDRRRGIGCDQLLVISDADGHADVNMRIFNPDGTEAEACGNGTRCVADHIMDNLIGSKVTIETKAGVLAATRGSNGLVQVDMGKVTRDWKLIPLARACDTLSVPVSVGPLNNPVCLNIGNPRAVFFVMVLASQ